MKTISIRELHEHTGKYVRQAQKEGIIVTDRGDPVAKLYRILTPEKRQEYWLKRDKSLSSLPRMEADSTDLISEDRDRR